MQFRAEDYYKAGVERMREARRAYEDGRSFALAMYCGGLAVECLLRAFRWTESQSFEGRHDLAELLKASRLLAINEELLRAKNVSDEAILESSLELRATVNDLAILWNNNLRFASEARLKAFLKEIKRVQGIKGDPLKKNALDLISAADKIITRGVVLWTSKKKS